LSSAAAWTIGTAKVAANVTNGAAFVNAGVDLTNNWGSMTGEQRAQSLLSMGFWGVTMLAGARGARSPGDLFNPAGMTRALADAYEPPVTRTTELGGNGVEIVLEPQSGRPMIRAGENASAADIQLHVNVARMMARNQGLQGQINGLLGRGDPPPDSLAYSAKYESIKLNQKVADLQARLDNPNLTPQQRAQLQGDIDTTNAYLDQQLASLTAIARSPSLARVASPSAGAPAPSNCPASSMRSSRVPMRIRATISASIRTPICRRRSCVACPTTAIIRGLRPTRRMMAPGASSRWRAIRTGQPTAPRSPAAPPHPCGCATPSRRSRTRN
jgi:hypothetical protein